MAVTANQIRTRADGDLFAGPVAATTHIYQGTMVFFDSDGYLVGIVAAGANVFAGIALEEVDNSAGAAGDLQCEYEAEGVFKLTGAGFALSLIHI